MKDINAESLPDIPAATPFVQTYFHGTKADLKPGDFVVPGISSNYGKGHSAKYVYITATLDAAIWGAELAVGSGPERIYLVESTGAIEDDPNLTDKKFPGNPTMSYRTQYPCRIVGELASWHGHTPEQVASMRQALAMLKEQGIEAIED